LKLARELREKDVDCEVYPSSAKVQKQLKYANDRAVQFVVLLGEEELKSNTLILKNMSTGEQETVSYESFTTKILSL
jgi:histidyl-tRNA synthetase